MLDLRTGSAPDCSGVPRRTFLRVGGLSAFGLGLPQYLKAVSDAKPAAAPKAKAKRCILLWMQGGPSHIDTFDPKPDAPAEVRGDFGTVATALPGVRFCDPLPMLAKQADKLAIIRGHDPKNGSHGVADHLMMTGHKFNASLPFPCFGSVVAKERGYEQGMLPFVQLGKSIDRRFNGGIAGFLGDEFNPFEVPDDPSSPAFKVRDLSLAGDAERVRLERRYTMLADLENYQKAEESSVEKARDEFYEKAHGIITGPAAKRAFDLGQESDKVRDRYGRNSLGQGCLLARRLIEGGVQFVTVTDGGWDTHTNNFRSLKDRLLPRVDRGLSALVEDLGTRGLLDDTLVVWFGDFGRTPKVNPTAGRDHWSTAGVAVMAGGGLKVGQVVGATNALAEYVTDNPVGPQDIAATIYHTLGVPLHTWYKAQDGRPIELCPEGKPVKQLV
ncbi:hypothetical protein : Uncharacterized protein OS=Singulisphaera acidiphila (strain ATCC BAA-1392 / DSM 18658 / VKM B-2454 / MOB10) GN=Sinac_3304 PE=4 SV=1: DUF1501 [Gemmataceae bacterium]|nr:hypothetical protein : Uncharacterized protein OS=Singulisphaera acidiphila (strain ATCC BAA-1392 / DSM 18658 / VKM B-2454 / MOB10) GN=Sinac_3304 PE=4 SV=1: DUF1501 [Gemmataceae bacterium]VTU02334.1 hypothetical protein : Uncharacterized protein OS=Singulisphaera acidiphila (strain ATCC BAA-1392 / DSM 18658 / VKM B-2454 / MOB10) GN=Sinac_3304 PE=4 SV=1: DUF1501 [Gemmataceae bacterium]